MADRFNPSAVEQALYQHWEESGYFKPSENENAPSYCIAIPPPNVTGSLHMGHAFQQTLMDTLIRFNRMEGHNTLWQAGTDHAGIATQMVVERKIAAEEGKTRHDYGREAFINKIWDWKAYSGGTISQQMRRLGNSIDWERERFTMDDGLSNAVKEVFVRLHEEGLIYRGKRLVNWDPKLHTAISDLEVENKESKGSLWHFRYPLANGAKTADGKDYLVVATTRPETMLGDTAVAVHPEDERYQSLIGKTVVLPLANREIPIIADEYVDREFGTGVVKITPAHDFNDYEVGKRHSLPMVNVLTLNADIRDEAEIIGTDGKPLAGYEATIPADYRGLERFAARKKIVADFEALGLLDEIKPHDLKVPYGDRGGVPIEPMLTDQWYVSVKPLADVAIKAVEDGEIQFVPKQYENLYFSWMRDIQDSCISRQLWWGHRIPAYFLPEGGYVVAATPEEALAKAKEKTGNAALTMEDLRQDEDCLDTWFSSWLWPISLFDGINNPGNEEIKYYYPTSDLVTGPDIIFFWVARMIMAGYEYEGQMPFKNVYFTGIVRDKLGRKMSKSLGNSPDPLELIDKYGADGVRMGMMLSAPAGNDILFDDALCEQGRNFCNKIWNAFRLIKGWTNAEGSIPVPEDAHLAVQWFEQRLDAASVEMADLFSKYRLSEALMLVYKLFWDEFSSYLLEIVKPAYGQPINGFIYSMVINCFERLLELLHPFMPFITEELWQQLRQREPGASLMVTRLSETFEVNEKFLQEFEVAKEIISNIRSIRLQKNIAMKEQLRLQVIGNHPVEKLNSVIMKMCNLSSIMVVYNKAEGAASFMIGTTEFAVPLIDMLDIDAEINRLLAELKHKESFLQGIVKKLSNEKFVNNAPAAVIELERKKQADAESIIKSLKESLTILLKR